LIRLNQAPVNGINTAYKLRTRIITGFVYAPYGYFHHKEKAVFGRLFAMTDIYCGCIKIKTAPAHAKG